MRSNHTTENKSYAFHRHRGQPRRHRPRIVPSGAHTPPIRAVNAPQPWAYVARIRLRANRSGATALSERVRSDHNAPRFRRAVKPRPIARHPRPRHRSI
jgi:hypothetical protein